MHFSRPISIESAYNSRHKYVPVTSIVIRNSMLLSLSSRIGGGGEKIVGAKLCDTFSQIGVIWPVTYQSIMLRDGKTDRQRSVLGHKVFRV